MSTVRAGFLLEAEPGSAYPEGTVGDADIGPGDDDGVFDGLSGNVDAEEGPVSVVGHLDVDGETLGVLKQQTAQTQTPPAHNLSAEERLQII